MCGPRFQAIAVLLAAMLLLNNRVTVEGAEPNVRQAKPSYPLFGLVGVDPAHKRDMRALSALDPQIFSPLRAYTGVHGGPAPVLRQMFPLRQELGIVVLRYTSVYKTNDETAK